MVKQLQQDWEQNNPDKMRNNEDTGIPYSSDDEWLGLHDVIEQLEDSLCEIPPIYQNDALSILKPFLLKNGNIDAYNIAVDYANNYVPQKYWILFYGDYYLGKTRLSMPIGNQALILHSIKYKFLDIDILEKQLQEYKITKIDPIAQAIKHDLLIFDDITRKGIDKDLPRNVEKIIIGRYKENRITVISANRQFKDFGAIFDPTLIGRIQEKTNKGQFIVEMKYQN